MRVLVTAALTGMVGSAAASESIDSYVKSQMAARKLPGLSLAVGGVMMNVVDFAKWDIAMTSGRPSPPSSVALSARPQATSLTAHYTRRRPTTKIARVTKITKPFTTSL
jgi:hypothetical protein